MPLLRTSVSESVGLTPKGFKDLLKAAITFPPADRTAALFIAHHAAVGSLPRDEALALMARALSERLPARAMREAATQHRYASGHNFAERKDLDAAGVNRANEGPAQRYLPADFVRKLPKSRRWRKTDGVATGAAKVSAGRIITAILFQDWESGAHSGRLASEVVRLYAQQVGTS